jgi:hypothetical protein
MKKGWSGTDDFYHASSASKYETEIDLCLSSTYNVHTTHNLLLLQKLERCELLLGETWTLRFVKAPQRTYYPKLVHKVRKWTYIIFKGWENHVTFRYGVVDCCLKMILEVLCQINQSFFLSFLLGQASPITTFLKHHPIFHSLPIVCMIDVDVMVHNLWPPWTRGGEWTSHLCIVKVREWESERERDLLALLQAHLKCPLRHHCGLHTAEGSLFIIRYFPCRI